MECIKLEERLTESRRECFRLKNEVGQLHEQAAKHRLRIRFKTVYAAGIGSLSGFIADNVESEYE